MRAEKGASRVWWKAGPFVRGPGLLVVCVTHLGCQARHSPTTLTGRGHTAAGTQEAGVLAIGTPQGLARRFIYAGSKWHQSTERFPRGSWCPCPHSCLLSPPLHTTFPQMFLLNPLTKSKLQNTPADSQGRFLSSDNSPETEMKLRGPPPAKALF